MSTSSRLLILDSGIERNNRDSRKPLSDCTLRL